MAPLRMRDARNTNRVWCLPLLALALALAAAGCGGGGDESTATGSSQEALQAHRESIEHFGHAAKGSEARKAEAAALGYVAARAGEEWSRACSYLSERIQHLLARFASKSKQTKGKGCPGFVQLSTDKLSESEQADLGKADVRSVRVEGSKGYVIYVTGNTERAISLKREGGDWTVASIIGLGIPLN